MGTKNVNFIWIHQHNIYNLLWTFEIKNAHGSREEIISRLAFLVFSCRKLIFVFQHHFWWKKKSFSLCWNSSSKKNFSFLIFIFCSPKYPWNLKTNFAQGYRMEMHFKIAFFFCYFYENIKKCEQFFCNFKSFLFINNPLSTSMYVKF